MRIAEFNTVTPAIDGCPLPWRLEQRGWSLGAAVSLTLLLALIALLATGLVLLFVELAVEPVTRSAVVARPAAALKIAIGISLLMALVGWPIRALALRLGSRREVFIDDENVRVMDHGPFSSRQWSQPIGSYLGLAHHIRTTHSGLRHELVLVHQDRRANVLIGLSNRMMDSEVSAACHRLGLPLVPAKLLYGAANPKPVRNQPTGAAIAAAAA